MVVPMMPRIRAYSAAEAPDSSRPKAFRRLIIIVTPFKPIRRGKGWFQIGLTVRSDTAKSVPWGKRIRRDRCFCLVKPTIYAGPSALVSTERANHLTPGRQVNAKLTSNLQDNIIYICKVFTAGLCKHCELMRVAQVH